MALSQGLFRCTANPLRSPVKTSEREQEEDVQGAEYPSKFDQWTSDLGIRALTTT
jgi:hypothetical protein